MTTDREEYIEYYVMNVYTSERYREGNTFWGECKLTHNATNQGALRMQHIFRFDTVYDEKEGVVFPDEAYLKIPSTLEQVEVFSDNKRLYVDSRGRLVYITVKHLVQEDNIEAIRAGGDNYNISSDDGRVRFGDDQAFFRNIN